MIPQDAVRLMNNAGEALRRLFAQLWPASSLRSGAGTTEGKGAVNWKRVLITAAVVFVVYQVMAFFVHVLWLGATYWSLAGEVWRPEAELRANGWIMFVTTAVFSFCFAYLFARGYEGGGWREGVRYGVIVSLFVGFTAVYDAYAVYPLPHSLVLKWFLSGLVMSIILGIVASLVYRKD
jgi:hypothetical protein